MTELEAKRDFISFASGAASKNENSASANAAPYLTDLFIPELGASQSLDEMLGSKFRYETKAICPKYRKKST